MAADNRVPVLVDPDRLDTVRRVAQWTGRSEEGIGADALIAYLDAQVMAVAVEEIDAVRAERRERGVHARAAS